jgi:hypothetical protein
MSPLSAAILARAKVDHGLIKSELADALDSKFRNHRFNLINSHQMPFAIFIGEMSFLATIAGITKSRSEEGRK